MCAVAAGFTSFNTPNLADMFRTCSIPFRSYAQGYAEFVAATPNCPAVSSANLIFSGDMPFQWFPNVRDAPYLVDFDEFAVDVSSGNLPGFSFMKPADFYLRPPH